VITAKPALASAVPSARPAAYSGWSGAVRALPNTLTALGSSASRPNPSTNSDWIRSTRQGSACTQSFEPRLDSSRSSVVPGLIWSRRSTTGPRWCSGSRCRPSSVSPSFGSVTADNGTRDQRSADVTAVTAAFSAAVPVP
jgi:hypothetical protein